MSPETLMLDRIEEQGAATSRKSTEPASEDAVNLTEDTTPPRLGHQSWAFVHQASHFAEGEEHDQSGAAVRIVFDERPLIGRGPTSMRASLKVLGELRADAQMIDWLEVAVVLKRDVARLRDSNYSRHAAVLLALADALTFTDPAEVSAVEGKEPLFRHALGLLSEPYISEASEEELLCELLLAGWNLAPSEEQAIELVD